MKAKTETILIILNVVAWVTFIGLCIKAGAILISYGVSIYNEEASKNLYQGMDLSAHRQHSFLTYTCMVSLKAALCIMQAYIAFLTTRLLSSINVAKPFSAVVAELLQKICYYILSVWIVAMVHNGYTAFLEKKFDIPGNEVSGDFLFIAGIVYVLAKLFERGVKIQSENELTV